MERAPIRESSRPEKEIFAGYFLPSSGAASLGKVQGSSDFLSLCRIYSLFSLRLLINLPPGGLHRHPPASQPSPPRITAIIIITALRFLRPPLADFFRRSLLPADRRLSAIDFRSTAFFATNLSVAFSAVFPLLSTMLLAAREQCSHGTGRIKQQKNSHRKEMKTSVGCSKKAWSTCRWSQFPKVRPSSSPLVRSWGRTGN